MLNADIEPDNQEWQPAKNQMPPNQNQKFFGVMAKAGIEQPARFLRWCSLKMN